MTYRFFVRTLLISVGMGLIVQQNLALADEKPMWQTGLSFSYLTGDYGRDEDTDIYYTAASIRRYLKKADITLTVPYLDIEGDDVTYVGGQVEPLDGGDGGEGLGDILLKGRYYAIPQEGLVPFINLVGMVKFPTADEDKGLGTGKTDFTGKLEFARRLKKEGWFALGEVGYTFVGEPDGYDADNRWLYAAGLAHELDPKITISSYLYGRTAIFEGNDDPLSILLISEYKFQPDLRFDTMFHFGLNDGAADFGITLGLRKRF